mgnify:CR=1 FL=1
MLDMTKNLKLMKNYYLVKLQHWQINMDIAQQVMVI